MSNSNPIYAYELTRPLACVTNAPYEFTVFKIVYKYYWRLVWIAYHNIFIVYI